MNSLESTPVHQSQTIRTLSVTTTSMNPPEDIDSWADHSIDVSGEFEETAQEYYTESEDEGNESIVESKTPALDDFDKQYNFTNTSIEFTPQDAINAEYPVISKLDIIKVVGDDQLGRKIIVISACNLPKYDETLYNSIFEYTKLTLGQYVSSDYTLIYLHHGLESRNRPSYSWLAKCYQNFDRDFKKNLKALYIVHPTMFIKFLCGLFRPIISSKFGRKINYIEKLAELSCNVDLEKLPIPNIVKSYDETLKSNNSVEKSLSNKSSTWSSTQQFGVSIKHIHDNNQPGGLAPVLLDSVRDIRLFGMSTDGIFRKCVSLKTINEIKNVYDKGGNVNFVTLGDPHVPAVILKLFLRSLDEPIFPKQTSGMVQQMMTFASEVRLEKIKSQLIPMLSLENRHMLKFLLSFLNEVASYGHENRMTAVNLGIIFGPNLVWYDDSMSVAGIGLINSFTEFIIVYHNEIFL